MRTKPEVIAAFTPNQHLEPGQKARILKIQNAYLDLATDIIDLVPDGPDRTSALRKLLDSKFTAVQAITHPHTVQKVQPAQGETSDEKEN